LYKEINIPEIVEEEDLEQKPVKLSRRKRKKLKKYNKKKSLFERTPLNDIKYRGPISIRGLRIIAWVAIVLDTFAMTLGVMHNVGIVGYNHPKVLNFFVDTLSIVGGIAIPGFMLAKFSMILQKKEGFKKMVITYFLMAMGVAFVFLFFFFHYGVNACMVLKECSRAEAIKTIDGMLEKIAKNKLCFNVFIDMFLWSSYFAIINYRIKEPKIWKKICKYLLALLPIVYAIGAFVIKINVGTGKIGFEAELIPFLPTTSPVVFLSFIVISFFISRQKKHYEYINGTTEGFEEFKNTNAHSLAVSKIIAKAFALAGFIDIIITVIIAIVFQDTEMSTKIIKLTGVSSGSVFIFYAPLILLFSYSKPYENDKLDLLVPVIGIVAIVFMVIECSYYTIIEYLKLLMLFVG